MIEKKLQRLIYDARNFLEYNSIIAEFFYICSLRPEGLKNIRK